MMNEAKQAFWRKAIQKIDLLITHTYSEKACGDGIGSAMIIRHATHCEVQFCNYGSTLHQEIPAREGVILCDMSPSPGQEQELADAGVLVLDHHGTQREAVESMGLCGIFREDRCGAELAYEHVWLPLMEGRVPETISQGVLAFAELCGIYDRWQRDSPLWEQAVHLREALLFIPWEELKDDLPTLANMHSELQMGRYITEHKRQRVEQLASQVLIKDGGIGIISNLELINEIADTLRLRGSDLKVVAGFGCELTDRPHDHLLVKVSLRSVQRGFDVSQIAKRMGGGGHPGAAGFAIRSGAAFDSPAELIVQKLVAAISGVAE
jgi:oligoribonuclease NrnB/cAMP/cGMP phosphodiesterase (DHH superfamily)